MIPHIIVMPLLLLQACARPYWFWVRFLFKFFFIYLLNMHSHNVGEPCRCTPRLWWRRLHVLVISVAGPMHVSKYSKTSELCRRGFLCTALPSGSFLLVIAALITFQAAKGWLYTHFILQETLIFGQGSSFLGFSSFQGQQFLNDF